MIRILPWITMISSSGSPAEWKVKIKISVTNTISRIVMTVLSFSNELFRSLQLVVSPTM